MRAAVICFDKPGALQERMDNRPAHLAYVEASTGVGVDGPLLDGDGKMAGLPIIPPVAMPRATSVAGRSCLRTFISASGRR